MKITKSDNNNGYMIKLFGVTIILWTGDFVDAPFFHVDGKKFAIHQIDDAVNEVVVRINHEGSRAQVLDTIEQFLREAERF